MRRTSSTGTVAPPLTTQRSEDRSRRPRSGCSSSAMSMVGTPRVIEARSVSASSSTSAGSNASTGTCAARDWTEPSTPIEQPAVWNIGIGLTYTSPGAIRTTSV